MILAELGEYKDVKTRLQDSKYNAALALIEKKDYAGASVIISELGDYKESKAKLAECKEEITNDKLLKAKVGDIVMYGLYEQDNNTSNGKEEVEWIVLDKQEERLLVISKYCLDSEKYNTEEKDITWENSTIRKWLNTNFIDSAFSMAEKSTIPTVTITNESNPKHKTKGGNNTTDKVFLLSIAEAEKYFKSDKEREAKPTAYAKGKGAYVGKNNENASWWLLSSGYSSSSATSIGNNGSVGSFGAYVDDSTHAVRPAMWIDTSLINQ